MTKRAIAVIAMAFNEGSMVSRWVNHYSRQVDSNDALHLLDHGSTDGSCDIPAASVVRLPREAGGDSYQNWRVEFVADYAEKLLGNFEAVLYVDIDEFVVADPSIYQNLEDYVHRGGHANATFGYDVLHDALAEPALGDGPILSQRNNLLFVGAMCKPTLLRRKVRFGVGFHNSSEPPVYGDLYRFHLRYADIGAGLDRLKITRQLERPEHKSSPMDHQKITDETYQSWVSSWLRYPRASDPLGEENPDFQVFKSQSLDLAKQGRLWTFDYSYRGRRVYTVPEEFRNAA